MPTARIDSASGPVELYYEATGAGAPLVWCHEYGGDHRSWEPQVRYFARRYRVVTWNYRGYPPSDVPKEPEAYSVDVLVEDLRGLLGTSGSRSAHVGGLSMGAGVALNFGIRYPEITESLIIAGAGSGHRQSRGVPAKLRAPRAASTRRAGSRPRPQHGQQSPTRRGFAQKDPRGWAETLAHVRDHSGLGSALMMRGVQMKRKTIYELGPEMAEDRRAGAHRRRRPGRAVPRARAVHEAPYPARRPAVVPMTGHASNLEEPALFNQLVADFLASVETGRWGTWQRGGR